MLFIWEDKHGGSKTSQEKNYNVNKTVKQHPQVILVSRCSLLKSPRVNKNKYGSNIVTCLLTIQAPLVRSYFWQSS